MNLKKILAGSVAAVVAASSFAVVANAEEGGVSYKAGLYYQTNAWTFRDSIAQSEGVWWDPDAAGVYNQYDEWQAGDVDITGDGTYMVYFEKTMMDAPSFDEDPFHYCKDGPEAYWNLLGLQTTIPFSEYKTTAVNEDGEEYEEMTVDITIDKLVIDGKEIAGATDAAVGLGNIEPNDYADGCNGITERLGNVYCVGIYNNWATDTSLNVIDPSDFGGRVMLVFTVTGLGGSGGNYTEGDEPNWLTLSNDEPAGDDDTSGDTSGDDDASTTTTTEASTTSNTTGVEYSAEGDNGIIYIILGIAAAVVVIIIVIVVIVKKKK